MIRELRDVLRDDAGSTLTEYGILLALISGVATMGLIALANSSNTVYTNAAQSMQNFQAAPPP